VADTLNINASRVSIVNIAGGSVIITVSIAADPAAPAPSSSSSSPSSSSSSAVPTPQELATQLDTLSTIPSSPFVTELKNATGVELDSSYQPTQQTVYQCPDGSMQTACPTAAPAAEKSVPVVGIAVGVGVGVLVLVLAIMYYRSQQQKQQQQSGSGSTATSGVMMSTQSSSAYAGGSTADHLPATVPPPAY
jgi:hypothetical protein